MHGRQSLCLNIAKIAFTAAGKAVFSNDETRRALTKLATDTNNEDVRKLVGSVIDEINVILESPISKASSNQDPLTEFNTSCVKNVSPSTKDPASEFE